MNRFLNPDFNKNPELLGFEDLLNDVYEFAKKTKPEDRSIIIRNLHYTLDHLEQLANLCQNLASDVAAIREVY